MTQKPMHIGKTLSNDIAILRPLVFDDDGRSVVVEAERVDATAEARRVLRGEERDIQNFREVFLKELLHALFEIDFDGRDLPRAAVGYRKYWHMIV